MLIIFDFDGTLVDTSESFLRIINEVLVDFKMTPLSVEDFARVRGMQMKDVIKEFKVPLYKLPQFAKATRKKALATVDEIELIKGIDTVIASLSQTHTLGVLTSNAKETVDLVLSRNKIDQHFAFVISEPSVFGKDKALKKVCKQHSLKPTQAMYVGDELRDIEACQKISMPIASVTWGFNTRESLEKAQPTHLIDEPQLLLKFM